MYNNDVINLTDNMVQETSPYPLHDDYENILQDWNHTPFYCPLLNEKVLIAIIDSLKNEILSCFDEIPTQLVNSVKYALEKPLLHILNASFLLGQFLDNLNVSIFLVYKGGDSKEISNYWSTSLLFLFSKIFERKMYTRLLHHLQ